MYKCLICGEEVDNFCSHFLEGEPEEIRTKCNEIARMTG